MSKSIIFAKLHAGFFASRKVLKAGRDGRDVFLHVLCVNAERGGQGWIPREDIEPWFAARALNISAEEVERGVTAAVTANLIEIDGETVRIVGWDDEWGRRALSNAERQRKFKAKTRSNDYTVTEVTTKLPVTEQSRVDQSRSERESALPPTASLSPVSIPGDFAASQKARKIAEDRRLDLVFELAQFRDAAAAKGWQVRDWDASFCKWLRQSRDVDRKPDEATRAKTRRAPHVSRQRTADGVQFVLTELDGNSRVISEDEAKQLERPEVKP